jgi:hypothetical protein
MNTTIPDDPFSGIVLPQFSIESSPVKPSDIDPIAVQISRTDSTSIDPIVGETPNPPTPEGAAIEVVANDGLLNKVPKHSTWSHPTATAYPTFLRTLTSGKKVTLDSNGLEVDQGTYKARIWFADLTKDLTLRELTICDAGVSKKILILASAPYV